MGKPTHPPKKTAYKVHGILHLGTWRCEPPVVALVTWWLASQDVETFPPQNFHHVSMYHFHGFLSNKDKRNIRFNESLGKHARLDVIPKIVFLLFLHGMSGPSGCSSFYFFGLVKKHRGCLLRVVICVFLGYQLWTHSLEERMMIRHYSGGRTVSRRVGES